MPLYEYKCEQCGDVFEVLQRFSDQPLTVHEKCGGAVHRLLSPPALQFKGSGWYITDYAKGGGTGNGSAKGSEEKTKGGGESEKKTDAPAKTESKPAASSSDKT
jgi:putative FmdB family regulatory protein